MPIKNTGRMLMQQCRLPNNRITDIITKCGKSSDSWNNKMHRNYIPVFLIFLFFIFGCSDIANYQTDPTNAYLSDVSIADYSSQSHNSLILGIYDIQIDPVSMSGTINPLRISSALGDSFDINLTPFLTVEPCKDCLIIQSIGLTGQGYIELRIQTRHPFKPVNRYDLHLFDLRAIVVTDRNLETFDNVKIDLNGDGTYESPAWGNFSFLVNADGYTSFYDVVIEPYLLKFTSGNICPFVNLWVNPSSTPGQGSNYDPSAAPDLGFTDIEHPAGHNVFPMGSEFSDPLSTGVLYLNAQESTSFNFQLILEASYGHSAIKSTRKQPRYFLPEFHRKEALYVKAEITRNDLWEMSPLSSAELQISAADWQAGLNAQTGWDFWKSPITAIKNKSDVGNIIFDIPGILNAPVLSELAKRAGGTGSYWDPYTWKLSFANEALAPKGEYTGLIAVRDNLEGSENVPYGIANADAIPAKFTDLSVYQIFKVDVHGPNIPPIADLNHNSPDSELDNGETITFQPGPLTIDPDGTIIKYEYDYDYDGARFNPDEVQNAGDLNFGNPVSHQFNNSGDTAILVKVCFRVTDNGNPAETDTDSAWFIIYPTLPDPTILFEDFETTSGGSMPNDWGVTGIIGDAYYCNTLGNCCKDTNALWGITDNSTQCSDGESKFLNDNGKAIPTNDPDETFQNRATIAYTPEFVVPTRGAIVTIQHKFNFTFATYLGTHYLDGGCVILSVEDPQTIEWQDFCYEDDLIEWNHPKRPLPVLNGPSYGIISDKNNQNDPLCDFEGHVGFSDNWVENQYFISSYYAGQKVRVGFVIGTCDPDMAGDECPESDLPSYLLPYLTIGHGWRINWVKVERVD